MGTDTAPNGCVGPEQVAHLLAHGHVELLGQIRYSSNIIFLARVHDKGLETLAIYKPSRGERPLWDFPAGTLCLREVAAYVLSHALGWPLVPPTVLRDGPHGSGAFQLYIDADLEATYFTVCDERQSDLLPVALFDVLINNADRKGGHLLLDRLGRIWAIDNALAFHPDPKLRTVIWDFAGQSIPERYVAGLNQLRDALSDETDLGRILSKLLDAGEIRALRARLKALLKRPVFPLPDPARRQLPWPVV